MSVTEEDLCHHTVWRSHGQGPGEHKRKASDFIVLHVVDKHILVFDPKQEEISFFHGKKTMNRDITKRQNKDLKFVFDVSFWRNFNSVEVEHTTKPILHSFLNGYNCIGNYLCWDLADSSDCFHQWDCSRPSHKINQLRFCPVNFHSSMFRKCKIFLKFSHHEYVPSFPWSALFLLLPSLLDML